MPIILLEGCDGTGKTTLARALGGRYVHHGPMSSGAVAWRAYLGCLLQAQRRPGELAVVDRAWPSEPIYAARVHRRAPRLSAIERRLLERVALAAGTVLVRCDPGWEAVRASYHEHGDRLIASEEQLRLIWDDYRALTSELATCTHDYRVATPVDALHWAKMRGPVVAPYGVVGRWAPGETVLLVGERPNGKATDTPFVSNHTGGCSQWLAAQLAEAGVRERDLTWANAFTARGRELSPKVVRDLRPRAIVLLGVVAWAWYRETYPGSDFAHRVTHPQYHKRFHARKTYPLIPLLKELTCQ